MVALGRKIYGFRFHSQVFLNVNKLVRDETLHVFVFISSGKDT